MGKQPREAWQRLTLRDGEKEDLTAEYLHTHIWVWDGSEDKVHGWHLLVCREVGAREISHYCLSIIKTSLKELAHVQAQHFFIEYSFREAKSECRLSDYQIRRWDAWHHHMRWSCWKPCFCSNRKSKGASSGRYCHSMI